MKYTLCVWGQIDCYVLAFSACVFALYEDALYISSGALVSCMHFRVLFFSVCVCAILPNVFRSKYKCFNFFFGFFVCGSCSLLHLCFFGCCLRCKREVKPPEQHSSTKSNGKMWINELKGYAQGLFRFHLLYDALFDTILMSSVWKRRHSPFNWLKFTILIWFTQKFFHFNYISCIAQFKCALIFQFLNRVIIPNWMNYISILWH